MKLAALRDEGIEEFRRYLVKAREEPTLSPPFQLLENPASAEIISPAIDVDPEMAFSSRLDLATYLCPLIERAELAEIESQTGVWSWLALAYFDQLCPADGAGQRRVGQVARYLFNDGLSSYSYLRAARHLVFCPVHSYSLHRTCPPMGLLCQRPSVHPDMAEQLFSSQELIAAPAVVQLADMLYYETRTNSVRSGATDRSKPGTVRRFVAVCNQLDLTFDLAQITAPDLRSLLPAEFDRW